MNCLGRMGSLNSRPLTKLSVASFFFFFFSLAILSNCDCPEFVSHFGGWYWKQCGNHWLHWRPNAKLNRIVQMVTSSQASTQQSIKALRNEFKKKQQRKQQRKQLISQWKSPSRKKATKGSTNLMSQFHVACTRLEEIL